MIIGLLALLAGVTAFTAGMLIVDYKRAKQGKDAIFWERKDK